MSGVDISFTDISEDTTSGEPMFGAPHVIGNTLDFDPVNFISKSNSGESSIVDSQLSFTVMTSKPSDSILTVRFTERGDYELAGLADATAVAGASGNVFWDILEINNTPVGSPISGSDNLSFTPSDGDYVLGTDDPSDVFIGELKLNVPDGTTKIRFTMDNTLFTAASGGGSALIKKKDGDIRVEVMVPEPASGLLALLGLVGLALVGRRRAA